MTRATATLASTSQTLIVYSVSVSDLSKQRAYLTESTHLIPRARYKEVFLARAGRAINESQRRDRRRMALEQLERLPRLPIPFSPMHAIARGRAPTSRSSFLITVVFSAIHATFPRTWIANAFPAISMGEPTSFVRSALSLRACQRVAACER